MGEEAGARLPKYSPRIDNFADGGAEQDM